MAPNMMDAAPHDTNSSMMHNFPSESTPQKHLPLEEPRKGLTVGHAMTLQDPENPQNWPVYKKVYASVAGYAFGFTVAFGVTAYTAGISGVMAEFNVSRTAAILGLSLNLVGIAFAPILTPHITERVGRSAVYLFSFPIFMLFILGASRSQSFASLAICRFFAGFFGGPSLVLIEGTFADCWSAKTTNTYYSILALSPYIGAACGPLIGGFVFAPTNWRWTQYVTLMLALAAYLLGLGIPETYNRTLLRRRAARLSLPINLLQAQSGVTLGDMAQVTLFTPARMLFREPVAAVITVYVAFNFAVLFQWFIAVPAVLHLVYDFTIQQVGLAFISAIVGSLLAALTSIMLETIVSARLSKSSPNGIVDIEYRLLPAMIGGFAITASLFWVGWTAKPEISWVSPILGTGLYVWGSMSVLISAIAYLFDAYPARGTLSALTIAATSRILCAAALPLVIIQMITNLTGRWAYSVFGFISIPMLAVPFFLFKFGPGLRAKSPHAAGMMTQGEKKGTEMHEMKESKMEGERMQDIV